MQLIQTVTVGAGGASYISLTSIPQTFTDLCLVLSGRSDAANPSLYFNFNFGGTYTTRWLWGTGQNAYSSNNSGNGFIRFDTQGAGTSYTSSTFSNCVAYIPNYTVSTTTKTIAVESVTETNASVAYNMIGTSVSSATGAVTNMDVDFDGNLVQGTTISLYGITKGSGGATVA